MVFFVDYNINNASYYINLYIVHIGDINLYKLLIYIDWPC